ncbi:MAG: flagellar protein FlgN [Peptostreptococcaceae bacterium]
MTSELKVIIFEEKNMLQELLNLLDDQYKLILEKDLLKIQNVSNYLDNVGKKIASIELKRREHTKNKDFKEIVYECDDEHVKETYESIKSLLNDIQKQKEVNEILIKQQLFFTGKMINAIKPSKNIGVYNSYGNVGK